MRVCARRETLGAVRGSTGLDAVRLAGDCVGESAGGSRTRGSCFAVREAIEGATRLEQQRGLKRQRRETYGLEFAWGLRGAGTSQRTRGPYLIMKVREGGGDKGEGD